MKPMAATARHIDELCANPHQNTRIVCSWNIAANYLLTRTIANQWAHAWPEVKAVLDKVDIALIQEASQDQIVLLHAAFGGKFDIHVLAMTASDVPAGIYSVLCDQEPDAAFVALTKAKYIGCACVVTMVRRA